MSDKWVRRWRIESHSKPGSYYVVALDTEGNYGCSCPHWIYRCKDTGKHCKHIQQVLQDYKAYECETNIPEPQIVYAMVPEVQLRPDGNLWVPLLPLGEMHFEATLIFDLLRGGIKYKTIQESYAYSLSRSNPRSAIELYVLERGRLIYDHHEESKGWTGRKVVPATLEPLKVTQ